MRRSRFNWWYAVGAWLPFIMLSTVANAQSASSVVEGALEMILPIGARTVGMGQTGVAGARGTEALWANPALIVRGPSEAGLHIVKDAAGVSATDASLAAVFVRPGIGAFALSVRYLNYGTQEATVDPTQQSGSFVSTTTIIGATFATAFTSRVASGLTLKLYTVGFDQTGVVAQSNSSTPVTWAIDGGAQLFLTQDSSLAIGAAVRNLGPSLQVNDAPQADPLPARVSAGIALTRRFADYPNVRLRASSDAVARPSGAGGVGINVGAELSWLDLYHARAGYSQNGPTGSGATFGIGASYGRWTFDFAQMQTDIGAQLGTPATYFSVRYGF